MSRLEDLQARAKALGMVVDVYLAWRRDLPKNGEVRSVRFRMVGEVDKPLDEALDAIEAELNYWEARHERAARSDPA